MTDFMDNLNKELESSWTPLKDVFGDALSKDSWTGMRLERNNSRTDLADEAAVGPTLALCIKEVWSRVKSLNAIDLAAANQLDAGSTTDKRELMTKMRLRPVAAGWQCQSAVTLVMGAGLFAPAMKAWNDSFALAGPGFDGVEAMALFARRAITGPTSRSWQDDLNTAGRLELLSLSPWWGIEPDWDASSVGDGKKRWTSTIADLGEACSKNPALAGACRSIVELSLPSWLPEAERMDHFGREIAQVLGGRKIVGGALCLDFWNAFPFEVRVGIALGVRGDSKMGAWCCDKIIGDAKSERRLSDLAAALWCDFDKARIDALDRLAPEAMEGFTSSVNKWVGSGSGIVRRHYLDEAWNGPASTWAKKLARKAGINEPEAATSHSYSTEDWANLMLACHAMGQALAIKKDMASEAKKVGPASKVAKKTASPKVRL